MECEVLFMLIGSGRYSPDSRRRDPWGEEVDLGIVHI